MKKQLIEDLIHILFIFTPTEWYCYLDTTYFHIIYTCPPYFLYVAIRSSLPLIPFSFISRSFLLFLNPDLLGWDYSFILILPYAISTQSQATRQSLSCKALRTRTEKTVEISRFP
jgi:hypothetical protein